MGGDGGWGGVACHKVKLRGGGDFQAECLIIGQVQMQHIQLDCRHGINVPLQYLPLCISKRMRHTSTKKEKEEDGGEEEEGGKRKEGEWEEEGRGRRREG